MSENEKKKKLNINAVLLVVVIIAIIGGSIYLINKKQSKKSDENVNQDTSNYELPDTTYNDMEVTDISMEYLPEDGASGATSVNMTIKNNTNKEIKNEWINVDLIDGSGNSLAQTETCISELGANEEYGITVVLEGDLTSTKKVTLFSAE